MVLTSDAGHFGQMHYLCTMENTINEEGKWKVLSTEYLIRRPWLTARRDVAQLPDGRINPEYYVLEYPD